MASGSEVFKAQCLLVLETWRDGQGRLQIGRRWTGGDWGLLEGYCHWASRVALTPRVCP